VGLVRPLGRIVLWDEEGNSRNRREEKLKKGRGFPATRKRLPTTRRPKEVRAEGGKEEHG